MAVVDASALIPLARIGRLDLISTAFDDIRTTRPVWADVLTEGKRVTATLETFLSDVGVVETPEPAETMAPMEKITVADASVIRSADEFDEILLANHRGLIEVARSQGVECR